MEHTAAVALHAPAAAAPPPQMRTPQMGTPQMCTVTPPPPLYLIVHTATVHTHRHCAHRSLQRGDTVTGQRCAGGGHWRCVPAACRSAVRTVAVGSYYHYYSICFLSAAHSSTTCGTNTRHVARQWHVWHPTGRRVARQWQTCGAPG